MEVKAGIQNGSTVSRNTHMRTRWHLQKATPNLFLVDLHFGFWAKRQVGSGQNRVPFAFFSMPHAHKCPFWCCGRKIDGPGLPGGLIIKAIYLPHGHLCSCKSREERMICPGRRSAASGGGSATSGGRSRSSQKLRLGLPSSGFSRRFLGWTGPNLAKQPLHPHLAMGQSPNRLAPSGYIPIQPLK